MDGFTAAGLVLPVAARRPEAMVAIQALCASLVSAAAYIAFMVGEYSNGARVFTAPIDYRPPPEAICRNANQRRRMGCGAAAFVWYATPWTPQVQQQTQRVAPAAQQIANPPTTPSPPVSVCGGGTQRAPERRPYNSILPTRPSTEKLTRRPLPTLVSGLRAPVARYRSIDQYEYRVSSARYVF